MKPPVDFDSFSLSPRIESLRVNVLARQGEFHEWFSLQAESLRRTQGEPTITRRAKAFVYMLEKMPLDIPAGALIVGRHPRSLLDQEDADHLRADWASAANPPDDSTLHFQDEGLFRAPVITLHLAPDTKKALHIGLGGICEELRTRLNSEQDTSKREFIWAALIAAEGASRFITRHADLLAQLAEEEADPSRQAELKDLAKICRHIALSPPRNFHEALQLNWFIYFLVSIESGHMIHDSGPGTLDRRLIDFYRQDIETGILSPEAALELLEAFLIEMNASISRGGILPLAIGGLDESGAGVENELTWLILKAVKDLRLLHPSLALRCHKAMPRELLRAALQMIGTGSTYPALFNDEVCVPSLIRSGVSKADACDWVHSICTELTAVGCTNGWIAAPYFNMTKALELTLNHGRCLLTGKKLGEDFGGLTTYKNFEELYTAYQKQIVHIMQMALVAAAHGQQQARERTPYPLLSCFTADCIDRGLDFTAGGARYNPDYIHAIGFSTAADSLAAIRRLVFDAEEVSAQSLLEALKNDFADNEILRQILLNKTTKYGNDDDYADSIAVRLVDDFYRQVERHTNSRGGRCWPGFMTWESHNLLGKGTGASADGRPARAALSDSVGAVQGMDRRGLTALLRSVTKIDYLPAVGGVTFNIKISPELFSTDAMLERLEAALLTYFDLGGFQVQINVLNREILEEAKAHPDRHRNLMVRVGGFSAYFVELDPNLQTEIIARTLH